MTRLRQTIWAIALWTVLVVLFWIGTVVELDAGCATAGIAASECPRELLILVSLIVLGIGWLIGALVLLATNPHGFVRWLLVRVMVNTMALIVTLALLSLVRLPARDESGVVRDTPLLTISDLLLVGLLFAIVNAVARPILFALFGRVILRTMGLAVLAINVVLFWFVGQLSAWLDEPWSTPVSYTHLTLPTNREV